MADFNLKIATNVRNKNMEAGNEALHIVGT